MTYKKIVFCSVIIGLAVSVAIINNKNIIPAKPLAQPVNKETEADQLAPSTAESINGLLVDPAMAKKRPIAVMVENHVDSRPQAGLADADIVYEALAEGGITRFLAVYQTKGATNIGPVRSARTYFAELANEIGAVYAHVGGNSDVLYYIKQGMYQSLKDADQFFYDPYFHRIKSRKAPHNVYTSTDTLSEWVKDYKVSEKASYGAWSFKDSVASGTPATSISVDFSLPNYFVSYKYDQSKNVYLRSHGGKPHTDADTGKQISAKNVVVQFVDTKPIESDTPLSIAMNLLKGGKAYAFMDGTVTPVTWKRSADARTRYYDLSGVEMSFNRGNFWIEIVPADREAGVTWK